MPPRLDSPLPPEPVFNAATDLHPNLHNASPKLFMLEEQFNYTAKEIEHCASKVGASEPFRLLSKTGVEKFRVLVEQFREQGLVVSEKNPDRDAIRGCFYRSRFLYDFMTESAVLDSFSKIAGVELIPLPIRYSQVQINLLSAYNPDAQEPGFGTHIDSTNFARAGSQDNVANAYLHMVLPDKELLNTRFAEAGSAVFQQGVLVPHQVENVRKAQGSRDTVAFTLHPANPMVRRLDFFSAASTWNSRDIKIDIGNLLIDLANKRIDTLNDALKLARDLAGTANAIRPEQLRELRAGLQNSETQKRVVQQFLVDLANGIDGISCPDDTFETPSVFDVNYKGRREI